MRHRVEINSTLLNSTICHDGGEGVAVAADAYLMTVRSLTATTTTMQRYDDDGGGDGMNFMPHE